MLLVCGRGSNRYYQTEAVIEALEFCVCVCACERQRIKVYEKEREDECLMGFSGCVT